MSSLVTKGNSVFIPAESLGGEKGKKVTVKWQQWMRSREADYWVCKYTVREGGNAEGVVFVQTSKLDELKAKRTSGDDLTVKIDDSFQYGGNKEETKLFLVYHDKDNKPYQHRFVENMFTQLGGMAADVIAGLGIKEVNAVADVMKHFVGDYLRDFW